MRILSIAALSFAMLFVVGCADEKDPLPRYSQVYDTNHDPQADFRFATLRAQESNRRILMFVGGDWCIWCRTLDKFLRETPAVNDFLHKHFVLLKVYYGRDNRNTKFLASLPPFRGTPHFYVFSAAGTILHSQPTEVLEQGGGYDELKLMTFLEKWVTAAPEPAPKAQNKPKQDTAGAAT